MGSTLSNILLTLVEPSAGLGTLMDSRKKKADAKETVQRRAELANRRALGVPYGGVQGTIGTSNVGIPDDAKTQRKTLLGS